MVQSGVARQVSSAVADAHAARLGAAGVPLVVGATRDEADDLETDGRAVERRAECLQPGGEGVAIGRRGRRNARRGVGSHGTCHLMMSSMGMKRGLSRSTGKSNFRQGSLSCTVRLTRLPRGTAVPPTGDEPVTGPQQSYLSTLAQQAGEQVDTTELTKAEASEKIEELKDKTGR